MASKEKMLHEHIQENREKLRPGQLWKLNNVDDFDLEVDFGEENAIYLLLININIDNHALCDSLMFLSYEPDQQPAMFTWYSINFDTTQHELISNAVPIR